MRKFARKEACQPTAQHKTRLQGDLEAELAFAQLLLLHSHMRRQSCAHSLTHSLTHTVLPL
jgi:hypothetical protein